MGFVRLPGGVAMKKQHGVGAERCETTGVGRKGPFLCPHIHLKRVRKGSDLADRYSSGNSRSRQLAVRQFRQTSFM